MDTTTFQGYAAQGYNRIPLMREVLADLDTPLSTFLKLANQPYTYLFESVQGGEKWGRYSLIGLPCHEVIRIHENKVQSFVDNVLSESFTVADPLGWVESFYATFKVLDLPNLPRFNGGLVGYFGYDTVRYIEPKLAECPNDDPLKVPDILLMVSDEVVVFDNLTGKLILLIYVDPADKDALQTGLHRLAELEQQLFKATPRVSSRKTKKSPKPILFPVLRNPDLRQQ